MSLFLVLFSSSRDGFSQGTNHKVTFGQKNSASYDILLEGIKTNTYLVNNTKAAIIPPTSCLTSNGYIATTLSEDYPRQYHEKTAKIDDFKIERGSEVVLQSNKLVVAPTNDDCANAIALTINPTSACSTSALGTTVSATQSSPGCLGIADDDVWFNFVATSTSHIVTVTPNTLSDAVFQVYSGTCATAVSLVCVDATAGTAIERTTLTGLTVGNTYYVRVYSYANNSSAQGTFSICVTIPFIPTNDLCSNAIALNVYSTSTCAASTLGTTESALQSSNGCSGSADDDVWYKFVATATSHIVTVTPNTLSDAVFQVYSGTCAALVSLICVDATAGAAVERSTLTGLTVGNTYYVRVYSFANNNSVQGTFSICITTAGISPPNTQDCLGAIAVCNSTYSTTISYSGTGNILNEINTSNSCLASGEKNDVWYTFTVVNSGNLIFTITPNQATDDYDWAIYNLTDANCPDIFTNPALMVSCNFSGTPGITGLSSTIGISSYQNAGGTAFNSTIPVIAGQTYVINISNFSSTQFGYTLNFGTSSATIYDNVTPTIQSVVQPIACGATSLGFNFSETVLCSSITDSLFALTGPGGVVYTLTGVSGVGCSIGGAQEQNFTINVSPALTVAGNYTLNYVGGVIDLCGNVAPSSSFNFTVTNGIVANAGSNQTVCAGNNITLTGSATGGSNYTYSWSPTTGLSNPNSNVTTISNPANSSASTTQYTLTTTSAGCSAVATTTIFVQAVPSTPGTITGGVAQCPSTTSLTYSIAAVAGATSYTWTAPIGWTITAGQGTTSITVTSGNSSQNGNITVTATNSCGTSSARSLGVTVNASNTAAMASSTPTLCVNTALTDITLVTTGATGIGSASGLPAGVSASWLSNTVTISGTPTASGTFNYTIPLTGGCGSVNATGTITVIATLAKPGTVSASNISCNSITLSWLAATNATGYEIQIASDALFSTSIGIYNGSNDVGNVLTSSITGLTSNTTYWIRVRARNGSTPCRSAWTNLNTISVSTLAAPLQPGTITGGVAQCPSTTSLSYSIAAVAGATSYTWTVPIGWSITAGQGTTSITVTSGSSNQNGNITVTATNSCGTSSASSLAVSVLSTLTYGAIPSNVNHVVISQIYGGGGNTSAIYTNDFVELFNPTNAPISLNGYSLQYTSDSGIFPTNNSNKVNLSGIIASGGYFLIQLFSNGAVGVALPTPDLSSTTINMDQNNGKIALVNTQNPLNSGICPTSIVDFVGYGAANCSEGSSSAPALSSTLADFRNGLGGHDTDVNAADFTARTPNPRNSTTLPQANQSFCVSGIPNLMTVNGASGSGSFRYQWFSRSGIVAAPTGTSTTGWTNLGTANGANTNIYSPSAAITSSTTYACFVTPSGTPTCGSGAWASGVRQITVVPLLGFVNLQFPANGAICSTGSFTAYGQVWLAGVTAGAGAGSGITVQFGYSLSNSDPSTWSTWSAATYNADSGNNDEYKYTLNSVAAGTYYYAFRYSNGTCNWQYGGYSISGGGTWDGTSNVSGILTVSGIPTTAAAGPDQTVCEGATITLAANLPTVGSGQWTIISGLDGVITTPSSPTSVFTGTINTTYTLRWTTTNGVCTSTSDDVVIRVSGINWANTQHPPSATICPNGFLTVFGQIHVVGLTEPPGAGAGIVAELGFSTTNNNPNTWTNWIPALINPTPLLINTNDEYMATLSGLPAGTYYYAFRYSLNGCPFKYGGNNWDGRSSVTGGFWDGTNAVSGVLTINQPTVAISGITTICSGSSTTLTASGANTYLWSNGSTATSITVSPTNLTTYTVTGTDSNNCTNTANVNIIVNPKPISTLIYHD